MRGTYQDDEVYSSRKRHVIRQQPYHLDVPSAANSKDISVISFIAREAMATPYEITIELTHPELLTRADYLGRDGHFTITAEDSAQPRVYRGIVTQFKRIKKTKDFFRYTIVVCSQIKRLGLLHRSRVFQHQNAPRIIESILLKDKFMDHQFEFKLRRDYPVHDFRLQYQISDLEYIKLLCEQEGIYFYTEQGKHGDVIVFGDDIDHYVYTPELKVPYRENAGLEAGVEAIFALETHADVVPQSVLVADYNPLVAWERFKDEANVAIDDNTTYGQPYVYGTNHLSQIGAEWEAQLRHEAAIAWQIVYHGQSNVLELRPGRILRIDEPLPDAPSGQVIIEVTHSGGRGVAYSNAYKAIPSNRRFRLPIDETKWPKIHGALSARVTSPKKYPYAYLTQAGHYAVRLDLDFDTWNPGGESVPLRLAKPFAGALQTGFHFPVRDGTEAVIMARDGDPNKLFISQFHHNSIQSDLIHNHERWMSRNVIRTQSNNKIRMEDWENEEHIKISTEHSGKSQLSLGHLVDNTRKKRGEGFELRTSGYGAIRAGKGMFISADDQPRAADKQLEMSAARGLLERALQQMQELAEATTAANALAANFHKQKALFEGTLNELKQAGILVSAPNGVALTSGSHMQMSANANLIATAGGSADIGVVKRFTVAAGEAISMCAHKLGIKLFAAKGKIEIQAQSDALDLVAKKHLRVASTDEDVLVAACKKLILACGGASLELANGGVVITCPGDFKIKAASFTFEGPQTFEAPMPKLPDSTLKLSTSYNTSR
ncbi:type IV secretion protein Rhs [Burkholderia sp. Leaf177]|uniref:type VI secretion system Vgr family protein n=1 Tax=Burkholderia sp. Leaf177 TaxID=1736287 RepID=UPI0006F3052F|nr:type VI secretion system Vgr family protein [Burkholderia sp. Leaf177]KQR78470.1 type IV secretion protein Rhs [Burkholderia sp. Leaf177]